MPVGTPAMNWSELVAQAATASDDFSSLEAGTYDFIVEDAKFKLSKTNKKQFTMTLLVDSPAPQRGRKAFYNVTLDASTPAFVIRRYFTDMALFGLDTAFYQTQPSEETVVNRLKNQKVSCELTYKESTKGGSAFAQFKFLRNLGMAAPVQQATQPPVNQPDQFTQTPAAPEAPATPTPVAAATTMPAGVPPLPPMM